MKNRFNLLRTVAAATAVVGLAPGVAAAQQAPSASNDDEDTIVVTARKREEALQDIPISVTAFGSAQLEDLRIQNTTDLAAFTPGFQFNEAFGRDGDRPVIRGTSNILIGEGKVGIFVDGAPLIGDSSALDLSSVERIEVIKGPQSAVYGRGSLSGAINYVMKRPTDTLQGRIEATAGNWDRYDIYGSLSGPVSVIPNMGFFVSAKHYEFGGDYNNADRAGEMLGEQKTDSLNAALYWDPLSTLSFSLRFMRAEDDDGHFAIGLQNSTANNCFLTTRPYFCGEAKTPTAIRIDTDELLSPGIERETQRVIFDGSWDIGGTGFTLDYQYTNVDQSEVAGIDQTYDNRRFFTFPTAALCPGPGGNSVSNRICTVSPFHTTSGTLRFANSHEVRISSPGDEAFRWRVGAFLLNDRTKPDLTYAELSAGGADLPDAISETDNKAVFAGFDIDITEQLSVGAEIRRQEDEIGSIGTSYTVNQYIPAATIAMALSQNPNQVRTTTGGLGLRSQTFKATLPRFTASYRLSDDVLFYGQYAEGNSPGGFNPTDAPRTTFDEEKLKNHELGVKTQLFGFDYLNASAFFIKYDNQVLTGTYLTSIGGTASYRLNVGEAEITGLELEASRELFEGLTLRGTYAYLDAEFVAGSEPEQALFRGGSYCAAGTPPSASLLLTTPASTVGGVPTNTPCSVLGSIVGKKPPLVADHQASLAARYERPIWDDYSLVLGADVTYRSSFYAQVDNLIETGDATKVNAQIGVEGDRLKLTLWGKNLNNDNTPEGILRYIDQGAATPASPPGFTGTPRGFAISPPRKPAFGITLAYDF